MLIGLDPVPWAGFGRQRVHASGEEMGNEMAVTAQPSTDTAILDAIHARLDKLAMSPISDPARPGGWQVSMVLKQLRQLLTEIETGEPTAVAARERVAARKLAVNLFGERHG